jgi:hypothetical protein
MYFSDLVELSESAKSLRRAPAHSATLACRHRHCVGAMTSVGRLIFFDQPGTGASDLVTTGALPTLEQWAA